MYQLLLHLWVILVAMHAEFTTKFDEKLDVMAKGLADRNIVTMLLIFITAGIFVGVVGRSSAESVAYFMLSIIPAKFAVAVLFCCLLCIYCNGYICWNNNTYYTNSGCGIKHQDLVWHYVLHLSWVVQCLETIFLLYQILLLRLVMVRAVP